MKCCNCDATYENLNSLKTHIRRVHGLTYAEFLNKRSDAKAELFECKICGLRSNNLNSHIVRIHNMATVAYKEQFPGSQTMRLTDEQVAKMTATKSASDSVHKHTLEEQRERARATIAEGNAMLVCQICGFESATSLLSHITRKHQMKMDVYRAKFPNAVVQRASPQQRKKNSDVMKKKLEDPAELEAFMQWRSFPSEVKHWIKKGFDPREAVEKVAQFQREQSLKGNNEKTRVHRSEKNSGYGNPMSLESIARRENATLEEAQKLTPCYGRRGEKHPMFGKKHSEEALRKIGQHMTFHGNSRAEHEMSDCLVTILNGGEKNSPVSGWCCDYVNSDHKLIVEFFGDFWHHNPNKYDKDWVNPMTKRSSTIVWERDARRQRELVEAGYDVIVVWESDWRVCKEEIMKEIVDAYNRKA